MLLTCLNLEDMGSPAPGYPPIPPKFPFIEVLLMKLVVRPMNLSARQTK